MQKTYKIDASGKILGRLSTEIANLLRGKNQADFLPYRLSNNRVIVFNNAKIIFTGKKFEAKEYIRHSGYLGGIKYAKLKDVFKKNPNEPIKKAVYRMLPKNKLRDKIIKNLKLYARVRLFTSSPTQSIGEGNFLINNRPYKEYFPTVNLQRVLESPFSRLKSLSRFGGSVKVKGGGQMAQAEAVSNGISRALVLFDINFRKKLKKSGFLHRDDRMVERKKFGLKKARRAPQWSKR